MYTFSYLSLRGGKAVLLGLASEPIFWELFSFWVILPLTRFKLVLIIFYYFIIAARESVRKRIALIV